MIQLFVVLVAVFIAYPLLLVALLKAAASDSTMFPEFSPDAQRQREDELLGQFAEVPPGRLEYQPDFPQIGALRTSRLFAVHTLFLDWLYRWAQFQGKQPPCGPAGCYCRRTCSWLVGISPGDWRRGITR